jgi:hypothetical protein
VNAEEQHVQVQLLQRGCGDRAHQGVRRRALAADQDHRGGEAGGTGGRAVMEQVGDAHRVGDNSDPGPVREFLGQRPGGGSRTEAHGHAFLHQPGSLHCNGPFLVRQLGGLEVEAGLMGTGVARNLGAAVDTLEAAAFLQHFNVAPHCHEGHPQLVGQIRDPDNPLPLKSVQNSLVTCDGEHLGGSFGQGAGLGPV